MIEPFARNLILDEAAIWLKARTRVDGAHRRIAGI